MISSTAKYALRAAVHLGSQHHDFVGRMEIAEATLVPVDYLLKVLNELVTARLVESRPGPGGGYRLTKSPDVMTALEVVRAVDAIPRITECPLGISEHEKLCPLHKLLDDASRLVEEAFHSATISDLIPGRKRSKTCDFPQKRPAS
ncbi:RrF2 family transcriptional regulator [Fuerstiella marisgermanici]|uniref:Iron-responsive transcriptional regulator n=1 Tax=Fuerstiella marisgermanici TaxID=1891926 RepID=A0A1P8WIJ2_9PLAN|nr:Rrf2 family transcriptional regulator [Fuerstiella marisgermanici]APZ93882.1 iron-responsive transcriptional regulator [Fuerstiella marisgermanici]